MKVTLTTDEIVNRLLADSHARWTRAGAFALVEYLEQLEEDIGEPMEFDLVAIRCDWTEAESLEQWAADYGLTLAESDDIREYIEERGTLIAFDGGVIVSAF